MTSRSLRPLLAATLTVAGGVAGAQTSSPLVSQMGIAQRLGAQLPLDARLGDEMGQTVILRDILPKDRPTLIVPVWFGCRKGCNAITGNVAKALAKANKQNQLVLGRDLDVVMLSIRPDEGAKEAAERKEQVLGSVDKRDAAPHWRFITADARQIRRVTDPLGLTYRWDPATQVVNHPIFAAVLTPSGKVSSYSIGSDIQTKPLEIALATADAGEVGPKADQSMMYGCITLEPGTDRNRALIERTVTIFGIITLGALATFILTSLRKERSASAAPEAR